MQIYVGKNGQQLGPFPIEEINRKLADGTFSATDLAWYEGAAGWAMLSTIPGVTLPATAAATTTPASAPAPISTPVAPAAVPVRSTTPIARTPVPASSYKTLTTVSWVLLGLTALVSLIPFVGCGAWMLGWAVAVAAIIMGIIVITRGGTGQGIMIIVGGVLIVPFALLGQFASLAVFGSIAGKEDRKQETQIMENLRTIDTAKGQWVTATKAKERDPVTMANLTSYLSAGEPKPVVGEQYDPSPVGHPPTATLPSDKSLGSFKKGEVLTAASLQEALDKSFSFYSFKNSPAPTATAKSSPAPTTGGKPPATSPKASISPKPSESVPPPPSPSFSARPSPSAKIRPDEESTVSPRPRTPPAETPSSRPSPSAKFAPPERTNSPKPRTSATVESSGLKQGKQNPGESPSATPEDDDD